MKALSNSDKIKAFIAPKMTGVITFLESNNKMMSTQEETFMEYIFIYI